MGVERGMGTWAGGSIRDSATLRGSRPLPRLSLPFPTSVSFRTSSDLLKSIYFFLFFLGIPICIIWETILVEVVFFFPLLIMIQIPSLHGCSLLLSGWDDLDARFALFSFLPQRL